MRVLFTTAVLTLGAFNAQANTNQFVSKVSCVEQMTQATNPTTGNVVIFPTPCDVPRGWSEVAPAELSLDFLKQYWSLSKDKAGDFSQSKSEQALDSAKQTWNRGVDVVEQSQTWQSLKQEGGEIMDQSQEAVDKAKDWIEEAKQDLIKWLDK